MKIVLVLISALLSTLLLHAQNYGEIHGRILDYQSGNPLAFATVSTQYGEKLIGATADEDGRFKLKPLQPGKYTVHISYLGYNARDFADIEVLPGKVFFLGEVALATNNELPVFEITDIKLINRDEPNTLVLKSGELKNNAMLKTPDKLVGSITPELKTDANGAFIVRGSRPGATATYIDGMRLPGNLGTMPGSAIKTISVYTGGVPAKYGDLTGGVVVIETKSYFDYFYENNRR